MYNSQRTLEVFGYDLENGHKRSKEEIEKTAGQQPKNLYVVDNCPNCGKERQIKLRQSRKNKLCSKCHHNTPEMHKVKLAQKGREFSEEHKQKMKDNHWSKHGLDSPFKGKKHDNEVKKILRNKKQMQFANYTEEQLREMRIKESCSKRGIPLEEFNGFSAPEGTRLRQSAEGKAWTYDVLAKSNFTCEKCHERGGSLHAHHKNAFNLFPEQRLDPNNGSCLCESCHSLFHKEYGVGDNTEAQFSEWINK